VEVTPSGADILIYSQRWERVKSKTRADFTELLQWRREDSKTVFYASPQLESIAYPGIFRREVAVFQSSQPQFRACLYGLPFISCASPLPRRCISSLPDGLKAIPRLTRASAGSRREILS
jgi:hypothetical protein